MKWLDGTLIANAEDAASRVQGLLYLLRDRYQLEAATAGMKLHGDYASDGGFMQLLVEVRAALAGTEPVTGGTWCSDAEARQYLGVMLAEFDKLSSPQMLTPTSN
jgi:hypothetical protein